MDGSRETFDLIVCATGFHLAYPFLAPELQRVKGATVKCYGGSFLEDYKGIYYIGWGQARGGAGSVLSAFAPIFTRFLKLQDEIKIPVGLALKKMGQQLPTSHLEDPQKIFRELKLVNLFFERMVKKAHRIDSQYSQFENHPLPLEFRLKAIRENANLNTVPFWQKLRNELPLLTCQYETCQTRRISSSSLHIFRKSKGCDV